jgi:hypothetical protein
VPGYAGHFFILGLLALGAAIASFLMLVEWSRYEESTNG